MRIKLKAKGEDHIFAWTFRDCLLYMAARHNTPEERSDWVGGGWWLRHKAWKKHRIKIAKEVHRTYRTGKYAAQYWDRQEWKNRIRPYREKRPWLNRNSCL